jgi:hypothetical protein
MNNNTSLSTAAASNAGAAALVSIASWLLSASGLNLPADVAASATVIVGALAHFVASLFMAPNKS